MPVLRTDALQQAQQELRLILENIKDYAVFTIDPANRITSWNIGAERTFGYTEAEAVGKSGAIVFTDEDRAQGAPERELSEAQQQGYSNNEGWQTRKDGSRFFASGVTRQLLDWNGQLRGFVKICRDVTARKAAEEAANEQRRIAEALRDAAIVLSSTLELQPLLDQILPIAGRVVPYDAAYILLIEGDTIIDVRTFGFEPERTAEFEQRLHRERLRLGSFRHFDDLVKHQTALIADVRDLDSRDAPPVLSEGSLLAVPVPIDAVIVAVLVVMSRREGFYRDQDAATLKGFAYHAALAIQNAQLYLHAREAAALRERQQLARELHDAVTQTLFTASLLTDSLPVMLIATPDVVPETLEKLNVLVKSALSEMRTLILELRPSNIESTPFTQLLIHLVNAVQGRKQIAITVQTKGEPVLPPEVHVAIYRITQEALNNMTKHSRATQCSVMMRGAEGRIEVHIHDDGIGFTPQMKSTGLGLQMMRERAEAVAAVLEVSSAEGKGTDVHVTWPMIGAPQA